MPEVEARNVVERFFNSVRRMLEGPVVWVRESIVEPNQQHYPWYHQKFRRVPTIDECYVDDPVCYYEANCQYKRDRQVDTEILTILRTRFEECHMYEAPDHFERCKEIKRQYDEATANWFTKYGDLGAYHNVRSAYMKQKHRMLWERRHGPVGEGLKAEENIEA
ncbi:nadh-ubiquinone oxidoreductase pdsw subunit [Holotrichia oblita]|uniref:Nadh-ubiquinone oxidoreductase pdsw subunit n=2 Tax=Holotrichia oblita TaxID=644536 RepID=A0ACB9SPA2_HOLOL|nr:nadh-ubiquinone oxidoreductase pdsw subunit [Holotrichia oblita]KAI4457176.1 nadh-ubiquinone oxidoreductase pdsw subunit [Holotrichia oblita]